MIRAFVLNQGKLISQEVGLDVVRLVMADEGVQIWVDAEKPTPEESKLLLEGVFSFHPLAIEDCIAVSERPKVDDYGDYLFMVIHAVDYRSEVREFRTSELNLFVGRNFLVTVHDDPMKSVALTIERVIRNAPAIAKAPDRLTYNLLDALLENYTPALEGLSEEVAQLEEEVLSDVSTDILGKVLHLKTQVQKLRQIVAPQREVLSRIAHGEFKIVRTHLLPYYRDLLDHLARIGDYADSYRDSLTNTLQINLNLQQMQVNRVIKVLTVMATLTAPVLIITSYYGMNIKHMPNTDWPGWGWAYLYVLSLTALMTGGIYWMLKKKNWM